jgi:hypothetical protein
VVSGLGRYDSASDDDHLLENLVHQNTRILNTKLDVLAALILERLRLREDNLLRIDTDKTNATGLLERLAVAARYHLREHRDKTVFYQTLFDLERERREQDVECWRHVVDVMRDFLIFWDAHERAKARAIFLHHAG